ncbi:hypothetical protein [Nocardia sp. NPDC020380]|uniref:hypothetical protein n=1 Tax=Nocardia sp. NPDC020380 TaxID=3364309 RepID=UPI0037B2E783
MLRKLSRVLMIAALTTAPVATAGLGTAQPPTPVPARAVSLVQPVDWNDWYHHRCLIEHQWWIPRCHPWNYNHPHHHW